MEKALLIGLSRQAALRRQLDVIANNVANLNTTGFKGDGVVFEQFLMPGARGSGAGATDRRVSFVVDRATWRDMRAGAMQQTGNPLDVAIDGEAFLVMQTPRGERYTRNGALKINAAGELVTSEGFPVLGEGGPVSFQPNDTNITIGRDGAIATDEGPRGRLRLVQFAQAGRLQKDGASGFVAPEGMVPQPATLAAVHQGAIEKSNVQAVREMSRMIEVTRSYSTIAQALQSHGDLRRSAIDKLADVRT
jgi:flagellar basal-body rod protein FlgF